jgi:hypothetical protein
LHHRLTEPRAISRSPVPEPPTTALSMLSSPKVPSAAATPISATSREVLRSFCRLPHRHRGRPTSPPLLSLTALTSKRVRILI